MDFPTIVYNLKWHLPPRVIATQEEFDALDPLEWTTIPPQATPKGPADQKWPQIYYDVNVPPIVVQSADELKTLDTGRYRPFPMTDAIVTAAQENLAAAAAPATP